MLMSIEDIVVRKRVRNDLGDLSSLMESMRAHGLLNPILINRDRVLVAGQRRLESAKRLGWHSIEVRVVDKIEELDLLSMEVDENVRRKELSEGELNEALARIERLKNPSLWMRIWRALRIFFQRIFGRRLQ